MESKSSEERVARKGAWACSGWDSGQAEILEAREALRGSGDSALKGRIGKAVPYPHGRQILDGVWAGRGSLSSKSPWPGLVLQGP